MEVGNVETYMGSLLDVWSSRFGGSPVIPYGDALLEHRPMIGRFRMTSGQREMLPDRAEA